MKIIRLGAAVVALILSLAGCSAGNTAQPLEPTAPQVTVTDSLGPATVPFRPQRVAVLDLAVLDILDALGQGERVVGMPKKTSVAYLSSYIEDSAVGNLGALKEVDMEALHALQPDMILIGGRLAGERESLAQIAPTLQYSVDHQIGYLDSMSHNVKQLAAIFGEAERAEQLLSDYQQRIAKLRTAAQGKSAMVGLVSSSSLSTLGNRSRASLITNEVGFENLAPDVDSLHGDGVSFEFLLKKNPDYIFILDRDTAMNAQGAQGAVAVMDNQLVKETKAYRQGHLVYLAPDAWYLTEGGLTATEMMLSDLESSLGMGD